MFRKTLDNNVSKSIIKKGTLLSKSNVGGRFYFGFDNMRKCTRNQTLQFLTNNRIIYQDKHLIPYSQIESFSVVLNANNYKNFVPWCKHSELISDSDGNPSKVLLEIGFNQLAETYLSDLTIDPPHCLISECYDGKLFKSMKATWIVHSGLPNNSESSIVKIIIDFEFQSAFYSNIAYMCLKEVSGPIVGSFVRECERKFGDRPALPQNLLRCLKH